ncbi:MAG TPA: hypothetical protein VGA95_11945 [Thermodesulfobacteriota bacterium]
MKWLPEHKTKIVCAMNTIRFEMAIVDSNVRPAPAKLRLDPYAKCVEGEVRWDEVVYPYHFGKPDSMNEKDMRPL